jgi:glycosyltransferase involved in cell wall biosynthesis
MRICFLADIRSIHTKRWIEFFAHSNEIHLITLNFSPSEMGNVSLDSYEKLGVKIHTLSKSFPGILLNSWRVRQLVRTIQPDLLHAHFATHYGFWGARTGFHPFVVSGWGDDVLIHTKKFGLSFFVNHALRSADLITCDGENSFEAIRTLGISREKIHLITHGVDTKKFSPDLRDPELYGHIFRNAWPTVICIRGFNPIYDPETIIRAIPHVLEHAPEVNFLIAGKGYAEEKMRALAGNLKISEYIHFCGWIPHEKLPPYLASSDIYLSASLSDGGVAVSTFEAMASGLAVVVTPVGDNQLWIKNNENGFIVPVGEPGLMAEKIIHLVRNPDLRRACGRTNRALVEEKQDYYKEMEKVHVLYKDLVKR